MKAKSPMNQDDIKKNALYKMFIQIRENIKDNLRKGNFHYESAITSLERYIPLAENMQSNVFRAEVYQSLALIEGEVGHYQTAQEYYDKAIAVLNEEEDTELLSLVYCALGEINRKAGNVDAAAEHFHHSRDLAESVNYTRLIIINYCNEGQLWLTQGDTDRAVNLLEYGLNLVHNVDWKVEYRHQIMPEILSSLGEAYVKLGNNEMAWRQSERALELALKENQVHQIARAYQTMALIAMAENMETHEIENYFTESKANWIKASATADLGHLIMIEANYWQERQNEDKLIDCYREALSCFEATHLDEEAAHVRQLLAEFD